MSFMNNTVGLNNFRDILFSEMIYDHIGNTSGNLTLTENAVTTAHFTGNHTVTLPTVSDVSKQSVCILDFTTVNASYPSITNTNIKYKDSTAPTFSATTGVSQSITGASNTTPIEITITSHGYQTGDVVLIASVGGNINANGSWTIIKTGSNTFTLNGSSGNATYTTGGTCVVYGIRNRLICTSFNGSDNWEISSEKYGGVLVSFSRPNLTANGSLGGASFAVSASSTDSSYYAWQGVDNNSSSTKWRSVAGSAPSYTFYNPNALKITTLSIQNAAEDSDVNAIKTATLYGSNNGSSWTSLYNISNANFTNNAVWDMSVNSTAYYTYHKITVATNGNSGNDTGTYGVTFRDLLFTNAIYLSV